MVRPTKQLSTGSRPVNDFVGDFDWVKKDLAKGWAGLVKTKPPVAQRGDLSRGQTPDGSSDSAARPVPTSPDRAAPSPKKRRVYSFDRLEIRGDQLFDRKTKERCPISSAHSSVSMSGQREVDRRVTGSRLLLTGVFAFGMRKKKVHDTRRLYLTVEGEGLAFSERFRPSRERTASKFAARVNSDASARRADAARVNSEASARRAHAGRSVAQSPPPEPEPWEQIRRLGELRDEGLITPQEFDAKKTELLGRL